jgi:hypothetical protein
MTSIARNGITSCLRNGCLPRWRAPTMTIGSSQDIQDPEGDYAMGNAR